MDRGFDDGGPAFLAVKIDDRPGVGKTARDPALIRNRFMKAGSAPAAAAISTLDGPGG